MKVRFAAYLPAGPLPAWIGHLLVACHAIPGVELATVLRDSEALPGADWADCLDALVFDRGASPLKSAVLHMPAGVAEWSALPTLNLSVHREVIKIVGLLNESLGRGQDIEWTTRMQKAGFTPFFAPKATIIHEHSRKSLTAVWHDCARSGHHMRQVRMQYPELFKGSQILHNRLALLLLSPAIALAITFNIVRKHFKLFQKQWLTIPAIYLTKIAWCWGAAAPPLMNPKQFDKSLP